HRAHFAAYRRQQTKGRQPAGHLSPAALQQDQEIQHRARNRQPKLSKQQRIPSVPVNPEDRRQSPRIKATLDARLDFSVLMRDAEPSAGGVQHLRACAGHTVNISAEGLAVVLHAQNIDEQYLLGAEGSMSIEL